MRPEPLVLTKAYVDDLGGVEEEVEMVSGDRASTHVYIVLVTHSTVHNDSCQNKPTDASYVIAR